MKPLRRAFNLCQSITALAVGLGVAPSLPHMWAQRGFVPAPHRPGIEKLVDGRVQVEDFGSDVRWHRIPDAEWPHPKGRPLADYAPPA